MGNDDKIMIKVGSCDRSAAFSLLVIFNPTAEEVRIWGTRYQYRDYDDQLMRGMGHPLLFIPKTRLSPVLTNLLCL